MDLKDFRWFDTQSKLDEATGQFTPGRAGALSRMGSMLQNVAKPFAAAYGTDLPAGRDYGQEENEQQYEMMKEQLKQKNLQKRAKEELEMEMEKKEQAKLDKLKLVAAQSGITPDKIIGETSAEKLYQVIAEQKVNDNFPELPAMAGTAAKASSQQQ